MIVVRSVVLAALLVTACSPSESAPYLANKVVMFVDLTQSITDPAAIEGMANVASDVVLKLPPDSALHVHPIDKSRAAPAIFKFEAKRPSKPSELRPLAEAKAHAAKQLAAAILERRRSYLENGAPRQEPISCILRSLETADGLFERACDGRSATRCWLLYLSDMVEDCADLLACGPRPCPRMALTRERYQASRTALQDYAPAFSLAYARVAVVSAAENGVHNDKNASTDERRAFWDIAFAKVQLSTKEQDPGFLPTLPTWFLAEEEGGEGSGP